MNEIVTVQVNVTTTGSAGSATGSTDSEAMQGFLLDVFLDFNASAAATTDTTVAFENRGGNLIVVSNTNTDGLYVPRVQAHDSAGAAISGVYELYALNGKLTVSVAQGDALTDCVVAYVRYIKA
jgi:hypothetical protein